MSMCFTVSVIETFTLRRTWVHVTVDVQGLVRVAFLPLFFGAEFFVTLFRGMERDFELVVILSCHHFSIQVDQGCGA